MLFRWMTERRKWPSDHVRACLTFISCAAYRGHRVRRDHGPQGHRCHPEAGGKTTKEVHKGWVLTSLSFLVCSRWTIIFYSCFVGTNNLLQIWLKIVDHQLIEEEVSHTCQSSLALPDRLLLPFNVLLFQAEEKAPPCTPPLSDFWM